MFSEKSVIHSIMKAEGWDKYTDNENDEGGKTKWGITEKSARAYGWKGEIKDIDYEWAYNFYKVQQWDAVNASNILKLSPAVCEEVVDSGVNLGVPRAAEWLQRSLNSFNKRGTLYPDLVVDGDIGAKTIAALESYLIKREEVVLLRALNSLQGAYYIERGEVRQQNEDFTYGWFLNRVKI